MPTIRVDHNIRRPFVILDKEALECEELSLKARGLWATLMTKPQDWMFRMTEIVKHIPDGMDSLRTAINELEEKGYIVRTRDRTMEGQYGDSIWVVYEVLPTLENPIQEEPTLLSIENTK